MDEWGLPGLQARYDFLPAGEQVELRLDLRFDPAKARLSRAGRKGWLELRDRLAGGPDNRLPPSLKLVTSLASAPLTATSDGEDLRAQFVDFLSQLDALPDETDVPVVAALVFSLPMAGVADLPGDIFELAVRLEIWPIPIAVAQPRFDEAQGEIAFATAFEDLWRGFDGAGGRLALAREDGSEPAALWCVRTGSAHGIAVARPADADVEHFAVPPLSTLPLSGQVEGESGSMAMQAIDLDQWWAEFAAEMEAMETGASGRLGDRFERLRGALAAGLAPRLLPVARGPDAPGLAEARAAWEAAAAAKPSRRPFVASAQVEVSRGRRRPDEPETVLRGRTSTWTGAAYGASPSPAGILLAEGPQWLAYPLPREAGSEIARPVHFKGDRIDRQGHPPLRFLLDVSGEADALALELGARTAASPLIAIPKDPSLSVAGAGGEGATLEAALSWSVEVEILATGLRQDRFELAFDFEPGDEAIPAPGRLAEGALFEALGKAVLFARSTPAGPDPDLARIERFAGLAESVAEALPGWSAPVPEVRPLPGRWRYAVDFRDLPALIVEREGAQCPWPELAGFVAGKPAGGNLRYEPEAERAAESEVEPAAANSLRLSLPGPKLLADRQVRVHARTVRNSNLAGAVEPAFVYHGTIVSALAAAPRPDWRSTEPEPQAASLEAALASLLGRIDEKSGDPYRLGIEAALVRRLDASGGEGIESRGPLLLLSPVSIGGEGGGGIGDLGRELARALAAARALIGPSSGDEALELAVTLSDEALDPGPLAGLGFRIPAAGSDAWWGPT